VPKPQLVDVDYDEFRFTTAKGGSLFVINGKDVWLPAQLIEVDKDELVITMPEWLAKDKELI